MINIFWDLIIRSIAELAFPVIKELLKLGMFNHLEQLVKDIKEQIEIGVQNETGTATKKAADAESRANAASTPEEEAKYKAMAEVWREVAEGLKKENQTLKKEVENKVSATETEIAKYQAKADTWREAYENLQKENNKIKVEIDILKKLAIDSVEQSVSNLQISDVFDMSKPEKIELKKDNPLLNPSSKNDVEDQSL
jgi:chromosome segregation ATPase